MLSRTSGGNDGIKQYLENGIKNDRDFNRNELDKRVPIIGNLKITDTVINNIPNNNQDRYYHITLSFKESYIEQDKLNQITEEYIKTLMSAYSDDEYNVYAEAHLPKMKFIEHKKNGNLIERKPHIHIVIPKINLKTGKSLEPIGLYTANEKYLDAIQENINYKFNLESPKDNIRITDYNKALVLERIKGDTFKQKKEFKENLLDKINSNSMNYDDLKNHLVSLGELKIRNENKTNEYLSIKINGDTRFTNLKSPLFMKEFLNNGILKSPKPTFSDTNKLVDEWVKKRSKEVKYILPMSKKNRDMYYKLDVTDKLNYLDKLEVDFEYKTKRGRTSDHKSSSADFTGTNITSYTDRLPSVRTGVMVYSIDTNGRTESRSGQKTARVESLLQSDERDHLGNTKTRYDDPGLRRIGYDRPGRGGLKLDSSFIKELANEFIEIPQAEIDYFKDVRKFLDARHLLNNMTCFANIDANDYKITKAKDGSDRINVGKRNLNVSDFLTKEMNLSWEEARLILHITYQEQLKGDFDFYQNHNKKTKELIKENSISAQNINYKISWEMYRKDRKNAYNVKGVEREIALSEAIINKLKRELIIKNNRRIKMAEDNRNRNFSFKKRAPENSLDSPKRLSLSENLLAVQKELDYWETNSKKLSLLDITRGKSKEGNIEYKIQSTGETCFRDKGEKITFPSNPEADKIAIGLEVAIEKYGENLKLSGASSFKEKCALVAAERGLKVTFDDEQYQKIYADRLAELAKINEIKGSDIENTISADFENSISGSDMSIETQSLDNQDINIDLPGEELPGNAEAEINLPGDELPGNPEAEINLPGDELPGNTEAEINLPGDELPGNPEAEIDLPGDELPGNTEAEIDLPGDELPGNPEDEINLTNDANTMQKNTNSYTRLHIKNVIDREYKTRADSLKSPIISNGDERNFEVFKFAIQDNFPKSIAEKIDWDSIKQEVTNEDNTFNIYKMNDLIYTQSANVINSNDYELSNSDLINIEKSINGFNKLDKDASLIDLDKSINEHNAQKSIMNRFTNQFINNELKNFESIGDLSNPTVEMKDNFKSFIRSEFPKEVLIKIDFDNAISEIEEKNNDLRLIGNKLKDKIQIVAENQKLNLTKEDFDKISVTLTGLDTKEISKDGNINSFTDLNSEISKTIDTNQDLKNQYVQHYIANDFDKKTQEHLSQVSDLSKVSKKSFDNFIDKLDIPEKLKNNIDMNKVIEHCRTEKEEFHSGIGNIKKETFDIYQCEDELKRQVKSALDMKDLNLTDAEFEKIVVSNLEIYDDSIDISNINSFNDLHNQINEFQNEIEKKSITRVIDHINGTRDISSSDILNELKEFERDGIDLSELSSKHEEMIDSILSAEKTHKIDKAFDKIESSNDYSKENIDKMIKELKDQGVDLSRLSDEQRKRLEEILDKQGQKYALPGSEIKNDGMSM